LFFKILYREFSEASAGGELTRMAEEENDNNRFLKRKHTERAKNVLLDAMSPKDLFA